MTQTKPTSLISDILQSFISLPKWVKFWLMFILGPMNMASLYFINEPSGGLIVGLAWAGMMLSLAPVVLERGLSKLTAAGHLIPWTILVLHIVFAHPPTSEPFDTYLIVLAVVNTISLAFDYIDTYKWIKGERAVVRPTA